MFSKLKKINFYFLSSFLLIFCVLAIKFPTLSYKAEVFAEAGTNFFLNAKVSTFFQSLLTSDAGYLPFIQRLFSEIIVKLFHVNRYFPLLTQIFALFVIAFASSFINFRFLRQLIPSDSFRFVCGFVLGFFPDYDMYTYINFVYFGYIYLVLIYLINFNSLSWSLTIGIGVIGFLFITSKALLLAVAPFFGLQMVYSFIRKRNKELFVSSMITLGALIQTIFVLVNIVSSKANQIPSPERDPINLLSVGFHLLLSIFVENVIPIFYYMDSDLISELLIFAILMLIGFLLFRSKRKKILIGLIVLPLVAYISILFFLKFIGDDSFPRFNHFIFQKPVYLRWYFIAHESILLLFLLCVGQITKSWLRVSVLIVFLFYFPSLRLFTKASDLYGDNALSHSDWEKYYILAEKDVYCIPVNPSPWYISNKCISVSSSDGQEVLAIQLNYSTEKENKNIRISVFDSENQIVRLNKLSENDNHTYWLIEKPSRNNRIEILDEKSNVLSSKSLVYYVKN